MADDDRVGAHRVQRHRGVDQRFALLHARLRGVHVDDVGAEPLARDLEGEERAGRIFEKGVDDGKSGERIVMLGRARTVEVDPLLGGIVDVGNFKRGELRAAGQMIGRAQCRERVCKYVYNTWYAVYYHKNNINKP